MVRCLELFDGFLGDLVGDLGLIRELLDELFESRLVCLLDYGVANGVQAGLVIEMALELILPYSVFIYWRLFLFLVATFIFLLLLAFVNFVGLAIAILLSLNMNWLGSPSLRNFFPLLLTLSAVLYG